ncbi:MAG TPA: hypothetical protein VFG51_00690 [Candidatus Saccharimonadia bacterium]|nr:hypothetical protein [Candidatus Saccharimonadia bacterium]
MNAQQLRLIPSDVLQESVKTILLDHDMDVIAPMLEDILQRFESMEQELRKLRAVVRVEARD